MVDYQVIKKLKIKRHKGNKLSFAERNILNMYDRKMEKQQRTE